MTPWSTRLYLDDYADEINGAAHPFDLDPALVRAVIHTESGFNVRECALAKRALWD